MDKRLIIIHPSLIVRKGLHSILRDSFADEFLLLSTINDLVDYPSLSDMEIIIMIDELIDYKNHTNILRLNEFNNTVLVIEISLQNSNESSKINLLDNQGDIVRKVKELYESQEKSANEFSELSVRERDVLKLVALGFQNKEIAEQLFISIHTVITHRKNITEKLGIKSISGLTVYAILNKLIDTKNIDPSTLI